MKENLRILLMIFIVSLLMSISSIAQETCIASCGGNVDFGFSSTDNITCSWTGPNGFTSTECDLSFFDMCLDDGGLYTVTVTDDCGGVQQYTADIIVSGPVVNILANNISCFIFATIANCDNPTYQWTSPSGVITTTTQIISPVPTEDCGLWTFEVIDCDGCTDCAASTTYNFEVEACCEEVPPECFAAVNITKDNCVLTANVSNCDGTPAYLWSTGATTQSISVILDQSYTVTVTGCCDDPMEASFVVTGCEPPPACDCDVVITADDINCLLPIVVSGPDCANYNMIVQKFNSQDCSANNCTLYFGGAFSQTIDPDDGSGCANLYGGPNVSYRVTLLDNGSGPDCDNVFSNCVVLDCCDDITSVINETGLQVSCGSGTMQFEPAVGAIQFIIPDCCDVDLFDDIGTIDVEVVTEVNGSPINTTSNTNPLFIFVSPVSPFALNLQTSGAAYTIACENLFVGAVVTVTTTVTNITINGTTDCDYSGDATLVYSEEYTITADDIGTCCGGCPVPAWDYSSYITPPSGEIRYLTGIVVITCGDGTFNWSANGTPTAIEDVLLGNNSPCSDVEIVLPGGSSFVPLSDALDDINSQLPCGSELVDVGGSVILTGPTECVYSITYTVLHSAPVQTGCFGSSFDSTIDVQDIDGSLCCA